MNVKTRANLANEYRVCRKTLRKWMGDMPYEFPHLLTAPWQKIIYEDIGYPPGAEEAKLEKVKFPKEYRKDQK